MAAEATWVKLVVDPDDGDRERADEDVRFLMSDLARLDVEAIERISAGAAPAGTKAGGAVELGALLVAVGGSGAVLPMVVGLVRDWLGRRGTGSVKLTIGDDSLELTGVSGKDQRRVLDEFLRRHQG